MANAFAAADEQQLEALLDAIGWHEPIDEWLQDEHRGLLSMRSIDGGTPLGFAAFCGNAGATGMLLEAGVDADQQTKYGAPLFLACMRDHAKCAELLLGAGASVDLANESGQTPLWSACI